MPILHWLNREQALTTAQAVPYRLLDAVPEYDYVASQERRSVTEEADIPFNERRSFSDNMLIQGDNLEALKALLPYYAGQVKCIYIDPPYNTRSAFEHYDDNLEHSTWLSMIYPRLELLRELLAEDGSIWVSIDDNEGHYLKVLMDEVFGRGNFVTTFIWQKVDSPNDNKVPITPDHEFVLCYSKNNSAIQFYKKSDESLLDAYPNADETGKKYRDRLLKKNGKNSLREDRPSMFFAVPDPDGVDLYPVHDDGREACWAFGKERVFEMLKLEQIVWKQRTINQSLTWVPYTREYAPNDPQRPNPTILLDVKTSRQAKAHQRALLPDAQLFDTVKPEHLVSRIFDISTNPGDLILDSFLGSGTTAAVAHKMGRRWIGIEMGAHAVTHCVPRLQQVVDGERGGISQAVDWQGGGGFHFFRLGETVFTPEGRINPKITFPSLAAHVWFTETNSPLENLTGLQDLSGFLGVHDGTAVYLLYNGILKDKSPEGGNVLTSRVLRLLPPHEGPKVIYGTACRFSPARLKDEQITFKQIPYEIKAR